MAERIHNIQFLGSQQIKERLAAGSDTVVIPLGSMERHGNPLTPLGLDGVACQHIVEKAARDADVLHTPLLAFGYAPEHMGLPGEGAGTVTFTAETTRRCLEEIGRSLIYHGFNKLVFVSVHSSNMTVGEDVMFSLRQRTGALVSFYGSRETGIAQEVLQSTPERLSSDIESAVALALFGDRFETPEFLARSYKVHAPQWLGASFSKRSGTGSSLGFRGARNVHVGMEDREYVSPIGAAPNPPVTAEQGRQFLSDLTLHLTGFLLEMKKVPVEVRCRDYPERVR